MGKGTRKERKETWKDRNKEEKEKGRKQGLQEENEEKE